MSDLSEAPRSGNAFTGKLGPLPVWAWGTLGAALILFYVYYRKGKASSGLVTGASVTGASPSNVSNVPLQDVATTNTGSAGGVADTNSSWLQQGIKQGSDLGFTPLDTETALRNYLNGAPLTQAQANIVNAVEKAQGSAPQGIGGTPSVEPTTTPAAPSALDQTLGTLGGTPLRDQIITDYSQILGRMPSRAEVNYWEASGQTPQQIRNNIAGSPEAGKAQ